jgi:hypothetical protein
MKSRLLLFAVVAAALLVSTGAKCHERGIRPKNPWAPMGPDSTWAGAPTIYQVVTTISRGAMHYVMDWGDAMDTTDASYASGETAAVTHAWAAPGTVSVHVQAINAAFPEQTSEWSPAKSVKVIPDSRPVIDAAVGPPVAVKGVEVFFTVKAHDPDGDSVRTVVDWDDSTGTTTGLFPSPCSVEVTHVFEQVETARVVFTVQDWKGAPSLPETVFVPVGTPGGNNLHRVAGYPEGPLDRLAPWPKWQHDLYNTGRVGGGR